VASGKTDARKSRDPFISRLRVRNFRSIADCDIEFSSLTVLLGFNAAGKSNILDSLRFVADAIEGSPAEAISKRGGIRSVLRRGASPAKTFAIWLDINLPLGDAQHLVPAFFGFEIGYDAQNRPIVVREQGNIEDPLNPQQFLAEHDQVSESYGVANRVIGRRSNTRLHLPAAALGSSGFAQLEQTLASMRFYELDSDQLRALDEETVRQPALGPAGEHLGHVLGNLAEHDPTGKERLDAYLGAIVPNLVEVSERQEGRYSTVQARFRVNDDADTEVFQREALSEGTLRAAGILAALFQQPVHDRVIPLIGIEEPEVALHPSTVNALYEALTEAAEQVQVIVTSQSSDLLDSEEADISHIRAVANVNGVTFAGPVDAAGREAVASKVMSLSELHRSGQMLPTQVGYPVEDRP
jgi:predicted ATPase